MLPPTLKIPICYHMTLSIMFIVLTVLFYMPVVNSVKFVEYETGYNPNLKSYEILSTITRSRINCGNVCETKNNCASFIFQASNRNCTLFSVFMTSPDDVTYGRYYVRSTVEEYTDIEVLETCSSGSLPSSSTNIALNKPVNMSSDWHDIPPALMTDGTPDDTDPLCAHTNYTTYPEAVVDLGQTSYITALYILNRRDCCSERLHDLVIQIGNTLPGLRTVFNHTGAIGATCTILFDRPHQGRYVKLFIEGTEYLTICELEVY